FLFFSQRFCGNLKGRMPQCTAATRENATIECSQTYGDAYFQMYWYRQRCGENMRQIVFTIPKSPPDFEADFKNERFQTTKPDAASGTLIVGKLEPGDSGVYFCAPYVYWED
uniref:Ig-like domain-containing protein n=1 Tax=Neogobius melanostomus TaxID=47308 RepID=A0A8C6SWP5_9GOBI